MNWLDAAIVLVVIWFTYAAFQAGFIREVVTILAAIIGILLAGIFYNELAEDVLVFIDSETLARIIAFAIILGAVVLAGQMLAMVLKPTVNLLQLGIFDHLAGAGFGFLKGMVFILIFIILFITYPRWGLDEDIEDSTFASAIADNVAVHVVNVLPNEFEAHVDAFVGRLTPGN